MKSTVTQLKSIFENDITAVSIAENVESLDQNEDVSKIYQIMDEKSFDILCCRNEKDRIIGFWEKDNIDKGFFSFSTDEIISDSTSLITVFEVLEKKERIFVIEKNKITRIITRSDLEKTPVRLWLFGLISLLEMQLKDQIRITYPNQEWKEYLTLNKINYAESRFEQRKNINQELDIIECLQIVDLKNIVFKSEILKTKLFEPSDIKRNRVQFQKINKLRNIVAHSQNINGEFSWQQIFGLTNQIISIITRLEALVQ